MTSIFTGVNTAAGTDDVDGGNCILSSPSWSVANASTLSVWEDVASLEHFVWNTVHKQFYDRKGEWYDPGADLRLAMWWVPVGHRPTMAEAMERFRHLDAEGDSAFAFGWRGLQDAKLWQHKACD